MSRMSNRRNVLRMVVHLVIGLGIFSGQLEASVGMQPEDKTTRSASTDTRRTTPRTDPATSDQLHQAVTFMLDPDAMSRSILSFVEEQRREVFATSPDATEDMRKYPGYEDRVRRRIEQEVRGTVLLQISDLQRQYEGLLRAHLTRDDIQKLLAFQSDPISAQLRGPAYARALDAGDSGGTSIVDRIEATMTPQQRAFTTRFQRSPTGRKVVALGPQLETFRDDWVQRVLNEVARRMPAIAESIAQEYKQ